MLNTDAEKRFDVTELRIALWMRGSVCTLTPYQHTKHLPQDCLLRQPIATDHSTNGSSVYSHPRPVYCVSQSIRARQQLTETASARKPNMPSPSKKKVIKGKISSAGKKLVKTILHRPSSSRNYDHHQLESDI